MREAMICIHCDRRMFMDQFDSHVENYHHRKRRTPAAVATACKSDGKIDAIANGTDNSSPGQSQLPQGIGADQNVIGNRLITDNSSEKLPNDQAEMQLDPNRKETELASTKGSRAESDPNGVEVVCQLCHTRVNQSALEFHLNAQHFKVKPYRCQTCDFRAPTAELVEIHQSETGHKGSGKPDENVMSPSKSYLTSLTKWSSTDADKADVLLDQNQNETELNATGDSHKIHSGGIQPSSKVSSKNARKVPRRKEIRKNPLLLKMTNFLEEKRMKNHSAETIAKKCRKRPAPMSDSGESSDEEITEPNTAKWHRGNSTGNRSTIEQHSTARVKKANRVAKRRNSGPFECDECGNTYSSLQSLQAHSYTHGTKKFRCRQCQKVYKHPTSLCNHKRLAHPTAKV